MNRLRTLAGFALVAGLLAGLTSCNDRKGDSGADLDAPPPVLTAGEGRSVLDITSPADLPAGEAVDLSAKATTVDLAQLKDRQPQSVSVDRLSSLQNEVSPALEGAAKAVARVKIETDAAPKGDTKDEVKVNVTIE